MDLSDGERICTVVDVSFTSRLLLFHTQDTVVGTTPPRPTLRQSQSLTYVANIKSAVNDRSLEASEMHMIVRRLNGSFFEHTLPARNRPRAPYLQDFIERARRPPGSKRCRHLRASSMEHLTYATLESRCVPS